MKTTRRFAVASLLVLAVAVVLGTTAPASAGKVKGTQVTLYPTAESSSPKATGTVTLSVYPRDMFPSAVAVSVSKLARNASYYMPVAVLDPWRGTTFVYNVPIQTDAHGNGESVWSGYNRGRYPFYPYYYNYYITSSSFQVYDSSGTLVLTSNP